MISPYVSSGAGLEFLRVFDEPLMLFGMDIPLFRPGFRMVIFSALLMACVLFWRHGIMGTSELTWKNIREIGRAHV